MFESVSAMAAVVLPPGFLAWALLGVLLASGLGFVAGCIYGKGSLERSLRSAKKQLSRLVPLVHTTLDQADRACKALKESPGLHLNPRDLERLDRRHASLLETVSAIVQEQHLSEPLSESDGEPPQPFEVTWVGEPTDSTTSYPARTAFQSNLENLLAAGEASRVTSGLLLASVDRLSHLRQRFGRRAADAFLKQVGQVLCLTMREEDLICRFDTDGFAILMPNVDERSGSDLAESLRAAVREHRFQLGDNGHEVLVTASFGFVLCPPGDKPTLAVNRATAALASSRRKGRNQLHVHDGAELVHQAT